MHLNHLFKDSIFNYCDIAISFIRFLDKAAVISPAEDPSESDPWRLCTVTQVDELKVIIGMLPIWTTGIVFFAVLAQFSSTFLEQGRSMNRRVGAFAIPPASLASFDAVSVLIWVPSTTGSSSRRPGGSPEAPGASRSCSATAPACSCRSW